MGAHDFMYTRKGLDANKLYSEIIEEDREEYGQSSGLSRKMGLQKVTVPAKIKEKDIGKYIDSLLEKSEYGDKYGPTFYIEFLKSEKADIQEIAGCDIKKPEVGKLWKTVYVVKFFEYRDREVVKDTKTEAINTAKELAAKGVYSEVTVEKRLTTKNTIAIVSPKYKKVNKYINSYYFFGFMPS